MNTFAKSFQKIPIMASEVKIFSGRATRYLAENIALSFGKTLGEVQITTFSDGEFTTSYEENLRGNDVYIVQSTFPPAINLLELLLLVDAAKRASARQITAVIPYFGFARQDRKDKPPHLSVSDHPHRENLQSHPAGFPLLDHPNPFVSKFALITHGWRS